MADVRRTPVLAIILASYFMIVVDIPIVITAIPQLQDDSGFSATSLSWVRTRPEADDGFGPPQSAGQGRLPLVRRRSRGQRDKRPGTTPAGHRTGTVVACSGSGFERPAG
jgi:hypothetical protein